MLSPEHATLAFIGAGGYRQWVAGPEAAVRRLVADSLQLFHAPTMAAAGSIKAALQAAADAAAASLPADLPDHLRDRLVELAADSIASWQAAARGQLHCFFLGEKTCPENESFAELQRQLTLLLSTPPAEEHEEPGECCLLRAPMLALFTRCAALCLHMLPPNSCSILVPMFMQQRASQPCRQPPQLLRPSRPSESRTPSSSWAGK